MDTDAVSMLLALVGRDNVTAQATIHDGSVQVSMNITGLHQAQIDAITNKITSMFY